jgi:hypothetical protein
MRLLNAISGQMNDFLSEENTPAYAILSHTWSDEEVTLADMARPDVQLKKGHAKIRGCCRQAAVDGFEWVWVDTYVLIFLPSVTRRVKFTIAILGVASIRPAAPSFLKPSTPCSSGTSGLQYATHISVTYQVLTMN